MSRNTKIQDSEIRWFRELVLDPAERDVRPAATLSESRATTDHLSFGTANVSSEELHTARERTTRLLITPAQHINQRTKGANDMDREMYLYECTACVLVFGVETAFEEQSEIVCPYCESDEHIEDAGTAMATITQEPEVEGG